MKVTHPGVYEAQLGWNSKVQVWRHAKEEKEGEFLQRVRKLLQEACSNDK